MVRNVFSVALAAALASSCGSAPVCGPENCSGCCAGTMCVAGFTSDQCGAHGAACAQCFFGESCSSGICVGNSAGGGISTGGGNGSTGGGNGSTGGGNGSTGGGNGSTGGGLGTGGGSAVGGGGGAVSESQQGLSGSRLKVQYYQGDDGSRVFKTMFDTMRNEACAFTLAIDGTFRCTPSSDSIAFGGYYWSDANCSVPIYYSNPQPGCSPIYGALYSMTCPQMISYATLVQANPTTLYYQSGGSCMSTSPTTAFVYFSAAQQLQPSTFVQGTVGTEP